MNLTQRTTYILNDLNINKFDISISHEEEFAVAFAIGYYSLTLEKEKNRLIISILKKLIIKYNIIIYLI